jgi:hypothetical protein
MVRQDEAAGQRLGARREHGLAQQLGAQRLAIANSASPFLAVRQAVFDGSPERTREAARSLLAPGAPAGSWIGALEAGSALDDAPLMAAALEAAAASWRIDEDPTDHYRLSCAALRLGRPDLVASALDRLGREGDAGHALVRLLDAQRAALDAEVRDGLRFGKHNHIASQRIPGAQTLVVAFGYPNPPHFGVKPARLQALFGALGASSVLMIDPARLCFTRGVPPMADGHSSLATALRELKDRWGARRLVLFGFCMGGFAALRLADEAKADAVFAFAPLTSTNAWMVQADARYRPYVRLFDTVPLSLRSDIAQHWAAASHQPPTTVYFSWASRKTLAHASQLVDLPNVTLLTGFGPSYLRSIDHLGALGDFAPRLAAFLDGSPPLPGTLAEDDPGLARGFAMALG